MCRVHCIAEVANTHNGRSQKAWIVVIKTSVSSKGELKSSINEMKKPCMRSKIKLVNVDFEKRRLSHCCATLEHLHVCVVSVVAVLQRMVFSASSRTVARAKVVYRTTMERSCFSESAAHKLFWFSYPG